MYIEYYILNPCGNITALVTSKVELKDYGYVNSKIMEKHKDVEQVGFVDFDNEQPGLCMSGGEFCGNAVMCAALLFCKLKNKYGEVNIDFYGLKKPIKTVVTEKDGKYNCCGFFDVRMDICVKKFSVENYEFFAPMINTDGISHIILDYGFDRDKAIKLIKEYSQKFNLSAMGVMFFDYETKKVEPLVFVKEINTVFFEKSCASGSMALCKYLFRNRIGSVDIIHPGGVIKAENTEEFVILSELIEVSDILKCEI